MTVGDNRSYGYCPTQLDGITRDGRPFYFRSRSGAWTLRVGECGWVPNICGWPTSGEMVAHGASDVNDPDTVDSLVTEHLGPSWRHVSIGETLFLRSCNKCGREFRTEGSTICTDCLVEALGKHE